MRNSLPSPKLTPRTKDEKEMRYSLPSVLEDVALGFATAPGPLSPAPSLSRTSSVSLTTSRAHSSEYDSEEDHMIRLEEVDDIEQRRCVRGLNSSSGDGGSDGHTPSFNSGQPQPGSGQPRLPAKKDEDVSKLPSASKMVLSPRRRCRGPEIEMAGKRKVQKTYSPNRAISVYKY